jgi:hypothetical protein
VIDIADEKNMWFYDTAYHFDGTTRMLHVMVPEKVNPSIDGNMQLDSTTKGKWEVEWFEEGRVV